MNSAELPRKATQESLANHSHRTCSLGDSISGTTNCATPADPKPMNRFLTYAPMYIKRHQFAKWNQIRHKRNWHERGFPRLRLPIINWGETSSDFMHKHIYSFTTTNARKVSECTASHNTTYFLHDERKKQGSRSTVKYTVRPSLWQLRRKWDNAISLSLVNLQRYSLLRDTCQSLHQPNNLRYIIQIILGFAGFFANCARKHFCSGSNGWAWYGTCNYLKHVFIRSVIPYAENKIWWHFPFLHGGK